MACNSTQDEVICFENVRSFPPVINGKINLVSFLEAATDLVGLVERLGTVFTPVKIDMQGNIDRIKKHYKYDENSCLLMLMLDEASSGKALVTEGVLWLNRALLFFELVFVEILESLHSKTDVNMKIIFTKAYEGSVKKYHNWVTQQLFTFICKMSPTFPQMMKSFRDENNINSFEMKLASFNITLHLIRCKIDDFFKDNNLFKDTA